MKDAVATPAERNGGNPDGIVTAPDEPARDAGAATRLAAIIPPSPAAVAVCGARIAIDIRTRAGEYWVNPQTLTCEAELGPGIRLREAVHLAVEHAVDRIEELKRGG